MEFCEACRSNTTLLTYSGEMLTYNEGFAYPTMSSNICMYFVVYKFLKLFFQHLCAELIIRIFPYLSETCGVFILLFVWLQSLAVRVSVVALDASKEFPVLFVVKEQRGVLAWQVPLLLMNV